MKSRLPFEKEKMVEKELTEIKVHLAEIRVDLQHHIKRTELLESEVREWRKDIEPVQKHVGFVSGLGKLIGFLSITAAGIAAIVTLL